MKQSFFQKKHDTKTVNNETREILKPKISNKYIHFDDNNNNNCKNNDSLIEISDNYPFLQYEKKLNMKNDLNHPKFTKLFKLPVDLLHNNRLHWSWY